MDMDMDNIMDREWMTAFKLPSNLHTLPYPPYPPTPHPP